MKALLLVSTFIYLTKCSTINTTTSVIEKKEIENLEKEKGELYSQISSAINDTIQTLEKANDTDARQGIAYMNELMAQIREFNDTNILEEDLAHNSSEDCSEETNNGTKPDNNSDLIGSGRRKLNKPQLTGYEELKEYIANSRGLTGKGGGAKDQVESRKKKERQEKYEELQKKLAAWKAKRDQEKQKVREYKARMQILSQRSVTEKCPDFGESKAKKRKKGGSKKDKRPCCRKCCKKSYMGCLK